MRPLKLRHCTSRDTTTGAQCQRLEHEPRDGWHRAEVGEPVEVDGRLVARVVSWP